MIALLLLWPALYNRFPLIFPDSGAYLAVAWGSFWTFDRSGFYGLFLKVFSALPALWGLWAGLVAQAFAIGAVLLLAVRALIPRSSPAVVCAIILLTTMTTSLPWHSAQLMPDAFTGPCILLTWLAVSRDPDDSGAPSLWLGVLAAGLMHYTHLGIVPVAAAAALIAQSLCGAPMRGVAKRAFVAAMVTVLIALGQFTANGLLLHRWSTTPAGPVFLFARLHEDGIVQPWLARHCGSDGPVELCNLAPSLPRDSQKLLWGQKSPLDQLLWQDFQKPSAQQLVGEMRTAAIGSIIEHPVAFTKIAAESTADQLVHFAPLDDECPDVCTSPSSAVYDRVRAMHPELLPEFLSTRQARGTIPKHAIQAIVMPVQILSIVLLIPFLAFARLRQDGRALSLLMAVVAGLIANAALAGVLSDVHDRYQSRVVWLVPLVELIIAVSWLRRFGNPLIVKRIAGSAEVEETL